MTRRLQGVLVTEKHTHAAAAQVIEVVCECNLHCRLTVSLRFEEKVLGELRVLRLEPVINFILLK